MTQAYVEAMLVRSPASWWKPGSWSSGAIEWFGAGHWSHYANLMPGRLEVFDARYDRVGGQPPGVRIRPTKYLDHTERLILRLNCSLEQRQRWLDAMRGQEGKPYDPVSILGFATGAEVRRDWRDPSMWFCSEFGIWSKEVAGLIPQLSVHANRIFPGEAGLILEAAGFTVMAHIEPGRPVLRPLTA